MNLAPKMQYGANDSDNLSLANQEQRFRDNRHKLENVQLEACANLDSIRESYKTNALALELNTLIYDLKMKNIPVMDISNRSISYLKLNLNRDKNMRQRAQNCLEELKENLEILEQKIQEISEKGQKVKGFQGIKVPGNLKYLVDEYLEQIKSTKQKWTPEDIETYSEEISKFNQRISQIEYAPSNIDELIGKLSNSTGIVKLK